MEKTEKEKSLDRIVEHTKTAKQSLDEASKIARKVGDNSGADEIAKVASDADRLNKKFEIFKDKKKS